MLLQGKVALITGGLGGIGLALAKEFLKNGLKGAVLLDIDGSTADEIIDGLSTEFGKGKALFIKTDIRNKADVENALKTAIESFKTLDVVVNNAGIADEKNWELLFDINLVSTYRLMKMALEIYLPKYKSGEEGLIINISSIAGVDPLYPAPVYSAAKAGVIMLGRSFGTADVYNKYNVKILTVCPGFTDTPLVRKSIETLEGFAEVTKFVKTQTAEELAKNAMTVIERGENGSAWICEGSSSPYQLKFHCRTESKE